MKTLVIKLIFFVVAVELVIVGGAAVGCFTTDKCDEKDSDNITQMLSTIATQSFALYAAEK